MVLKRSTAQISAAPLVHNDPPLKFSKQEFIENLEFFGKPASYSFRKVIYVPTNNLKLQSYLINSILALPIFSKFQLWSQISQWSSTNFVPKFKSYNLQLITFPKRYLVSKSNYWNSRYLQLKTEKRVKSTEIYIAFHPISHVFGRTIEDIFSSSG